MRTIIYQDDVKSLWPLWIGLYICYNGTDKETQLCEHEQISKRYLRFELFSETRKHEVGIVSNRRLERYGEDVVWSCTHRPSRQGSWSYHTQFLHIQLLCCRVYLQYYAIVAYCQGMVNNPSEVVTWQPQGNLWLEKV